MKMEESEIEETQQQHEPLFKLLSESCQQDGAKAPNPKFEDGKVLPKKLRNRFLQEAKPCVPLEEIDPYFRNKQTFIVIGRWGTVHRFSCNPDGQCNLSPNNALRRFSIYLLTNWIFSTLIVATVLLNAVALMKTQKFEINQSLDSHAGAPYTRPTWVMDTMYIVNYICLAIYCFELVLKLIARGFIGDGFTCFRDPWTWLDVVVIWTGFFPYYSFILNRRALLWLRIFKIIPLIPSIRQACKMSFKAVKRLGGMFLLLVLFLWFFSLIGLEMYMGTLTQKCIKIPPENQQSHMSHADWAAHNSNRTNWFPDVHWESWHTVDNLEDFDIVLCGNASGAGACPENYACYQGFGPNPDHGFTNFDNIFWSVLSVIRIGSEDFTEHIFRQILTANGPWHIIFFEAIFFFITIPMGCLFFGTLANFFKESKAPRELEMEELTGLADVHEFDGEQDPEALVIKGKNLESPDEDVVGFRKALHSFVTHDWFKNILIGVILIDAYGIASYSHQLQDHRISYWITIVIIPYLVFFLYVVEFILKVTAFGFGKYIKNRWNQLDLLVLLTFFFEFPSYIQSYDGTGYQFAAIRMFKLIQYWTSLRMIFAVYYKTIKGLWGWVLYSGIVFAFLAFIGPYEVGRTELEGGRKATSTDIPRFSFIDSWHSFRVIIRMQIGEWVETLWDVLPYGGTTTILFYLACNLCGALLISFLLVGVVHSTVGELQSNYDPSKDRGLRLFFRKTFGLLTSPIQKIQPREMIMKNGADSSENGEDDAAKAKAEGKDGGRTKKSIVAESTSQLRQVMQDCTEHIVYKIACTSAIVIASLAMIFNDKLTRSSDGAETILFVIEILFTVAFFVVAIYELLSFGFKESLCNRGWLFDVVIVLENALSLIFTGFSAERNFRLGMFCLRSFRPLMLISRVDWLKAPFRGVKFSIKSIWETVLAIWFIWLIFDSFAVHWLSGLYHQCIEPSTGEELKFDKITCLSSNASWVNGPFHFDNSGDGFLNMVFLVSRMGWVAIINGGSDATSVDMAPHKDTSKMWFMYFIVFVLMGGLGALGIVFSYMFKKFHDDKGYSLILTECQANTYTEAKNIRRPSGSWFRMARQDLTPPESPCMQSFFKIVTSEKFGIFIVALIIFDSVLVSMDYYTLEPNFETVIVSLRHAVLALYVVEMILKIVVYGKEYFRNGWNYLDMLVVITGILSILLADIMEKYFLSPFFIRQFRFLRVFQILLSGKYGCQAAKVLASAAYNVRHALGNLLLLQLTIIWAYAIFGVTLWENVRITAAFDDYIINFKTFGSAFNVLLLLLGFPCLDGLYLSLGNENDCDVIPPDTHNCGNKYAAIFYIGTYAALTFIILLNMYAALITEITFELGRFKGDVKPNEDDVPLEDVATENGHQQVPSNGEIGEQTEAPAGNSDEEE